MVLRVAFFELHVVEVKASDVDAARCACLEAEDLDASLLEVSESPTEGLMPFGPPEYMVSPMMISLSR